MRLSTIFVAALLAAGGTFVAAAPASAQVVQEVSFQGRLTNSGGTPITAATSVTFQLWTASVGGTSLWSETQSVTPNSNGIYAVRLGSVTAFPGGLSWNATYYLGITVAGDAEMTPRYQLTSSPFSLRSSRIGLLTDTGLAAATGVTDANLDTLTDGSNADSLHTHAFSALTGTTNVALLNAVQTFTANQTFSGSATFSGAVALPATGISGAGSGSGLDADLLDGNEATAFATAAHIHFGVTWAGNNSGWGLRVDNSSSAAGADGIQGEANSASGVGVIGNNTATTGNAIGVQGTTSSGSGIGVQGSSTAGSGVNGNASSGDGVYGLATTGNGVRGFSNSSGIGVFGDCNSTGTGVEGQSSSGIGGIFTTTSGTTALLAQRNNTATATNYAARIINLGGSNGSGALTYGLYSEVNRTATMSDSYAGYFRVVGNSSTDTSWSTGVWIHTDDNINSGQRHGLRIEMNGALSNTTHNTYGIFNYPGWGNDLRSPSAWGIYNGLDLDSGRTANGACYGQENFVRFLPAAVNSSTIYGTYTQVQLNASVTGTSYGTYVANTGSNSPTSYGGYFRSSPASGWSVGVYSDPLRANTSTNNAPQRAFYTSMVYAPTTVQGGQVHGLYALVDCDNNANATGSHVGAELAVRGNANTTIWGLASFTSNQFAGGTARAVYGSASGGSSGTRVGVYGTASGGALASRWAGYFLGNVNVTGTLSKGGGTFLIDHPLDPDNKILRHSFVESPEQLNIYKGRGRLVDGVATIQLPDWFDALNHPDTREATFTCKNGWSPLYLEGEITGNQFTVRTTAEGDQGQEFTWVIYGVRNDPFARQNPVIVEQEKGVGNPYTKGVSVHEETLGGAPAEGTHPEGTDPNAPQGEAPRTGPAPGADEPSQHQK